MRAAQCGSAAQPAPCVPRLQASAISCKQAPCHASCDLSHKGMAAPNRPDARPAQPSAASSLVLIGAVAPAPLNHVHVQAQALHHVDPQVAEQAVPERHHLRLAVNG